jgi:hypothetical protein
VTYLRSESVGPDSTRMVFALRNDTGHPVTFVGFLGQDVWYDETLGSEIKPQSTSEVSVRWNTKNQPRLVYAYVVPWTFAEKDSAEERYYRFPNPIWEWFMRKYNPRRPAYRHEVLLQ